MCRLNNATEDYRSGFMFERCPIYEYETKGNFTKTWQVGSKVLTVSTGRVRPFSSKFLFIID